jgi:ParB family chromosome partitioning protein
LAKSKVDQQLLPLPEPKAELVSVAVSEVQPSPLTARTVPDEEGLEELVQSVRQDGLLYPIKVRAVDGKYEVVCGHRRLEAIKRLGLETVRVEVVEMDDGQALRAGLAENLKRASLHPLEEARQFAAAVDGLGWTQGQLAQAIGRSRPYVKERLDLLQLPEKLRDAMQERTVTPAQAHVLAPLVQIGQLEDGITAVLKQPGQATEERLERMVQDAFRQRAIVLDDDTPFDWKTDCAARGCLGTGPDGRPVCTDPANYVASVAAVHRKQMASDVKSFDEGKGKKDGADALPVYYDLSPLVPVYGMKAPSIEDLPALPVSLGDVYAERGEAVLLSAVIPNVADKDGCRACPAWRDNGPGRALLVRPPSRRMLGERDRVQILCMSAACRKKKMKQGKSAKEVREQERERQVVAAQDGLRDKALEAARLLAKNPTRVLAVRLVRRDGLKQDVQLAAEVASVLQALGVNLPPFGGRSDALIVALEALGQETLLLVQSVLLVRSIDRAFENYQGRWYGKRLEGTLALLLGERVEEKLAESLQGVGSA